jgi:hypothetical protein
MQFGDEAGLGELTGYLVADDGRQAACRGQEARQVDAGA